MSNEMLSPLVGSSLRVEDKDQLDEFLARPDATHVVKTASFEEVFSPSSMLGWRILWICCLSFQANRCVGLSTWIAGARIRSSANRLWNGSRLSFRRVRRKR